MESIANSLRLFLRRSLAAVLLALPIGLVGVAFHHAIDLATELRGHHPWLLLLLPLGGIAITALYHICGLPRDRGTNLVLTAVRNNESMHLRTAPLIFISTVLTHLVGGSSGREGAALQLGASIASKISRVLHLSEHDSRTLTVCGMAAAFAALFGTPLSAAVFALEVVHVGVLHYSALVPALLSAFTGYLVAGACHVPPTAYTVSGVPEITALSLLQAIALGALCAAAAVLFCRAMHTAHHLYDHHVPNPYLRAAAGGGLVLVLTLALGTLHGSPLGYSVYNGAGGELIAAAVENGQALPWDFLLKILFTALTLGAGFKGGEIVPTFAAGAALGCSAAPLLGLSPSFGGALGMTALFCGVTNCPLTSILLSYELFGGAGLPLCAMAIAVTYRLSGYSSLYAEQRVIWSKLDPIPHDE